MRRAKRGHSAFAFILRPIRAEYAEYAGIALKYAYIPKKLPKMSGFS